MKKILLIFTMYSAFNFGSVFCRPQENSSQINSTLKTRVDSIVLVVEKLKSERQIDKHLIEILEKTNQQLNLWSNPYGIMIAALGILFAILAIISAGIIYRQNQDYKNKISALFESYKQALDKMRTDWEVKRLDIENQMEKLKSDATTATNSQKVEIDKKIKELESEKSRINSEIISAGAIFPKPDFSNILHQLWNLRPTETQCANCGYKFSNSEIKNNRPGALSAIKCPQCGQLVFIT